MLSWAGGDFETPALRAAYEEENVAVCARGGRAVCWLWIAVLPPFVVVDLARFPEQTSTLLLLRGFYLLAGIACLASLHTQWGARRPRGLILVLSLIGGAVVYAMMRLTGGLESPYFAGIGLVMLGTSLLMPWPSVWTWCLCAALTVMYAAYAILLEPIGDGRMFANALFSYVATAMIAGFATVGRERLRRREFVSRQALRDSEARLREEASTSAALASAGRVLIESLETPHVLDRLCQITKQLLRCDVSHTILFDREAGVWRGVARDGDSPEQWEMLRAMRVDEATAEPALCALREHGILRLDGSGPELAEQAARAAGVTAGLWLPLRVGDQIEGILTAGYRRAGATFGEAQERIAIGVARLASMALANARLHAELGRQAAAERRARSIAEAASRAKDEFLAMLSHELRTPLNVILGFNEIARDQQILAQGETEPLERVDAAGRVLLEMIDDILEMTRLQSDSSDRITDVSLEDLWDELEARCGQIPHAPAVALRFAEVPDLAFQTDRPRLFVILRNLIGNALKFTDEGWVEVAVEATASTLVFRIRDTGIGIPDEALERIFERFRQLDGSGSRQRGGLGLGLFIVRRCADQIGGSVRVESRVGLGSTFTLEIPFVHGVVRRHAPRHGRAAGGSSQRHRDLRV